MGKIAEKRLIASCQFHGLDPEWLDQAFREGNSAGHCDNYSFPGFLTQSDHEFSEGCRFGEDENHPVDFLYQNFLPGVKRDSSPNGLRDHNLVFGANFNVYTHKFLLKEGYTLFYNCYTVKSSEFLISASGRNLAQTKIIFVASPWLFRFFFGDGSIPGKGFGLKLF